MRFNIPAFASALLVMTFVLGCAAPQPYMAQPSELQAPQPIAGNSGAYMSPYTTDSVLAEWVDKAVNAKTGAAVGGTAGAYAGQKLAENIPFFGSMLGQKVGESAGRAVAIKMSGGEELIKSSSDLSFNNLDEMSVWLYVTHSGHEHYQAALDATFAIYPELQQTYYGALIRASAKAKQLQSSAISVANP